MAAKRTPTKSKRFPIKAKTKPKTKTKAKAKARATTKTKSRAPKNSKSRMMSAPFTKIDVPIINPDTGSAQSKVQSGWDISANKAT